MASDLGPNLKGKKDEKFMNKSARHQCWGARDKYWACLDKVDGPTKVGVVPEQCAAIRQLYETECPPTWVKFNDRKYYYEKYKIKLKTEGFQEFQDKEFMDKDKSEK